MTDELKDFSIRLRTLILFRALAEGEVLAALSALLHAPEGDTEARVDAYCRFVAALSARGWDLSAYLLQAASTDDNPYIRALAAGETLPPVLQSCAERELQVLGTAASLTAPCLKALTGYGGPLPDFETASMDFPAAFRAAVADVGKTGYGVFAAGAMFCLEQGRIVPAPAADRTRMEDLVGYQEQRRQVADNTRALAAGLPAANLLLYGDAGTGKSSTVKAVVNLLAPEGVRLVEVCKEQLREIPQLLGQLRINPLKFVLFLDDLSFQDGDDRYNALKAVLEGSASARPENVVIYATSNRRHLVKERFTDREGSDDVHRRDTLQEVASLSERFGQTVLFGTPDKALYLEIVREMAQKRGLSMSRQELERAAEVFALEKGGRSGRAARQYIDRLLAAQFEEAPHADT